MVKDFFETDDLNYGKMAIILKNKIYCPNHNDYDKMLKELGLKKRELKNFVKAKLVVDDNNVFTDIENWEFQVDQTVFPDWYNKKECKNRLIEAIKKWAKNYIFINKTIKEISGGGTYYFKNCEIGTITNDAKVYWLENCKIGIISEDAQITYARNSKIDNLGAFLGTGAEVETMIRCKVNNIDSYSRIFKIIDSNIDTVGGRTIIYRVEGKSTINTIMGNASIIEYCEPTCKINNMKYSSFVKLAVNKKEFLSEFLNNIKVDNQSILIGYENKKATLKNNLEDCNENSDGINENHCL